ncbi:ECF transporter S component [Alkalibaculum sp. M08DMB]|uniref:ECF transporter S component n=1 Tax=Alkalibaculum sporogenes TaxID=2655001 RepID=A0A6A7KCV1_9FIRM|nr:ECF transporter S component [Alkalibaculum sporogenes]MPW27236.1 ECF transporter S component [Alkalibaculum sporogenes]
MSVKSRRLLIIAEPVVMLLTPILLVFTTIYDIEQTALLSSLIIIFAMVPFFARFELSKPKPRDIVPLVVLSVIAALGRVAFAPIPHFKPVSAIVIVSGLSFGPQAGFMTGALSALASNMFFGQGPWTPWQMFTWGLVGYLAGLLKKTFLFKKPIFIYIYGFLSGFMFGWIMNIWYIIGFIKPITSTTVVGAYIASFYFDVTHAVATVVFLIPILIPWQKKLNRIKLKFGLME